MDYDYPTYDYPTYDYPSYDIPDLSSRTGRRTSTPEVTVVEDSDDDSPAYYKNCSAARAAGAAPILRGEAGYRSALDRDDDGVACE